MVYVRFLDVWERGQADSTRYCLRLYQCHKGGVLESIALPEFCTRRALIFTTNQSAGGSLELRILLPCVTTVAKNMCIGVLVLWARRKGTVLTLFPVTPIAMSKSLMYASPIHLWLLVRAHRYITGYTPLSVLKQHLCTCFPKLGKVPQARQGDLLRIPHPCNS